MLNQKHNYKNLKRKNVNGKRHYTVEGIDDFQPVPSVTTVLSKTKDPRDVEALEQWRKNIGYDKAQQITQEAAWRGTRMHKYLEDYCKTGVLAEPGTNPYAQLANGMAGEIINNGFPLVNEVWGTEVPLYFPAIYGGTTDCAGIHNKEEAIIDFKQTNKMKKPEWIGDYFIQIAAYGEAHNELYGTNIRKAVVMMSSQYWEYQEFVIRGEAYDKYRRMWWDKVEQYYKLP